eukprot:2824314-Prymnesium_polylepis.1
MFKSAAAFNGDLSGWEVGNVTNMRVSCTHARMRCSSAAPHAPLARAHVARVGGGLRAAAHEAGRTRRTLEHRLPLPRPCRRKCSATPPRSMAT